MDTTTSPTLLSSFKLGDLTLKNRVIMAPLTRARAGVERMPNALMTQYYTQRASAGLIITEATVISQQGCGWVQSPGIYSEEQTEAWKQITKALHQTETPVFLQLWHCGRASHSSFQENNQLPVSASAIKLNGEYIHTPIGKQAYETPRALEIEEIPRIIEDYRLGAERAKKAGFDGIEIHGANGYLIDQFLQSKTNQRTDKYGGRIENRYRFLQEIVEAILTVFSPEKVAVRLSPNGNFNDMGSPEYRELFIYVAQQLNRYGLGYLHIVDGLEFGFHQLGEPMTLREFREVFDGPLMGNCGYSQDSAEATIKADNADLIAFGRPYISNPDLVERFANNWPLNPPAEMKDWYSFGAEGYIDFPTYPETHKS
ncbi:alkene reductase [Crocosphaera sp. UHCC 0190]|uniref:alkene reductase n=1 Tax=Crocosphaera sp. UHCC 0190 TaxID=3110246 RepID=UPI002B20EBA8|nr:alkene reductase [Crocosphaera sp. UHCC 0190]MEA5509850.1 alkene reductase [Crocosphaera sp. UHCC 0190]